MIKVAAVQQIVRYPIKSMAGAPSESAVLGWHGLAGDRRFAFRRIDYRGDFPWLNASRFPELLLYCPIGMDEDAREPAPSHVRTPSGEALEIGGPALRQEISDRAGNDVEIMNLRNGVFDDAAVSVINSRTIDNICHSAGVSVDSRRFRANIILAGADDFLESNWIGGTLVFGRESGPCVAVTAGDVRCMMINLDPNTAKQDAGVMKYVVRRNNNIAGVYGAVVRTGVVHVGQDVYFTPAE